MVRCSCEYGAVRTRRRSSNSRAGGSSRNKQTPLERAQSQPMVQIECARAHIPSKHPKRAFTVASFSESFDAFGCTPVRQQSRGCKTMSACIDWCRHGTHVVRRPWHRKGTRAQSEGDKCALSRAPQGPPPFSIRYVLFRRLLFSGSWSVGVLYFGTSQCGNRSMKT